MRASDINNEGKTGPGLWANIHAKRERIKGGSGERMRKPGSKGAPTAKNFKDAASEGIEEQAANAAQQAAIAINMKKHHQKPKGVAEAGNKPLEPHFGMGDTRTPRDIKSQMSGASDDFVRSTAEKKTGPFHSKVAKMQGKLAKSELRNRKKGVSETALKDKADYDAKRQALQDLSMNQQVDQQAVQQRGLDLEKELLKLQAKEQRVAEGSLNEFAPNAGGEGGNYLKALASAWYNHDIDMLKDIIKQGGNALNRIIDAQEAVEKILARGIHCGDGKVRKYMIGYNHRFDGVDIQSDDHYEYADYDDAGRDIDSRTGKPWGPYDVVTFNGNELNESVERGVTEDFNGEYDDEAGMAETNLHTIARAAKGLLDTIDDRENLPEWVQEKIAKVEGMLVSAWDYLESQESQGIGEGKKPEHNLGPGWMLAKDKELGNKVAQAKAKHKQQRDTMHRYAGKKLEETYDGDEFYEAYGDLWYDEEQLDEAEYHGRKVPLGKPMQGDVKKFKVYVKDPSTGNIKKVNFGDPNMRIKKSNPARRKSFRARHNCDNPGPRTKARYWSCRKW